MNDMEKLLAEISPEDPGYYLRIATQAITDERKNFWTGDLDTGRFRPTFHGRPDDDIPDYRGNIWETAMLVWGVYDLWVLTGDEDYERMIKAQAKFYKENFRPEELEDAGGWLFGSSDDCFWNAMLYLTFYTVGGDDWFVERAINVLDNCYERWYDPEADMLYYNDRSDFMALYETGLPLCWLRLWEITGEQRFYDGALASYNRMIKWLARDDGLYHCEANVHYPLGSPENIREGGSSSFLTGNMAMAALSAMFYKITGEQEYLDRVYKTNEGLLKYYNNGGVLLDDRDGFTNGAFAAFYATHVLSLPGTDEMRELVRATARSIVTNDRTEDGYYGASWSGPAEGAASVWWAAGTIPQASSTCGTAVLMVTAAALLEAGVDDYHR